MSGGKQKILLVDDELSVLETYGGKLAHRGYKVITAISGHETVKLAKKHWPDIIVLDIMMPMADGYEILSQLKSDMSTKNIPVLVLSQQDRIKCVNRGLLTGADCYLIKAQNTPAEFVERVAYFLSHRAAVKMT